jgi:hypothetical protein
MEADNLPLQMPGMFYNIALGLGLRQPQKQITSFNFSVNIP